MKPTIIGCSDANELLRRARRAMLCANHVGAARWLDAWIGEVSYRDVIRLVEEYCTIVFKTLPPMEYLAARREISRGT